MEQRFNPVLTEALAFESILAKRHQQKYFEKEVMIVGEDACNGGKEFVTRINFFSRCVLAYQKTFLTLFIMLLSACLHRVCE